MNLLPETKRYFVQSLGPWEKKTAVLQDIQDAIQDSRLLQPSYSSKYWLSEQQQLKFFRTPHEGEEFEEFMLRCGVGPQRTYKQTFSFENEHGSFSFSQTFAQDDVSSVVICTDGYVPRGMHLAANMIKSHMNNKVVYKAAYPHIIF